MSVVEIYDDLVPNNLRDEYENILLGQNFPWFFWPKAIPDCLKKTNRVDSKEYTNPYQLKHVFNIKDKQTKEYQLIRPLVELYLQRSERQLLKIHGSAVIMQHPVGSNPVITPHVDFDHVLSADGELKSLIYYVNDSDGDTILYNEHCSSQITTELSVAATLQPIRGRVAVFSSNRFHSGSLPSKNVRLLINIIMELKKNVGV